MINKDCLCKEITDKSCVRHTFLCSKCTNEFIENKLCGEVNRDGMIKEIISFIFRIELIPIYFMIIVLIIVLIGVGDMYSKCNGTLVKTMFSYKCLEGLR